MEQAGLCECYEGVGWKWTCKGEAMKDEDDDIQVYQRPWVGLTDEDQFNLVHAMNKNDWHAIQMMDAIEAKLKEKNT
jgi:hypothetical protein